MLHISPKVILAGWLIVVIGDPAGRETIMKSIQYWASFTTGLAFTLSASTGLACSPEGFIGSMNVFAGNFAIRGCALAHGQLLSISQNPALFSILGTTYGGDGRPTFGLPDTRGRSVVGAGSGPGLPPVALGEKSGAATATLNIDNLPSHGHGATTVIDATATANASSADADTADPTGAVWAIAKKGKPQVYNASAPSVAMRAGAVTVEASATTTIGNTGGGQSFSIRDPYIGMYWSIQLVGVFPSRD